MNVVFPCNGCELGRVNFCGSALVESSKRAIVELALAVSFSSLDMTMPSFQEQNDNALESAVFPKTHTTK